MFSYAISLCVCICIFINKQKPHLWQIDKYYICITLNIIFIVFLGDSLAQPVGCLSKYKAERNAWFIMAWKTNELVEINGKTPTMDGQSVYHIKILNAKQFLTLHTNQICVMPMTETYHRASMNNVTYLMMAVRLINFIQLLTTFSYHIIEMQS